jgi:hypothetical protein
MPKGYIEARIYPREDYFFLIQYTQSEKGFLQYIDKQKNYTRRDTQTQEFDVFDKIFTDALPLTDWQKLWLSAGVREEKVKFMRDAGRVGVQVGKIFGDIALRIGMIDSFAGVGIDVDIPFRTEMFRWITTFEMYDFNGRNRIADRRPHLKWLNKMYIMRHIYLTFGADDFISKNNANAFYGVGIRFGDDDLKYLLGSLSGMFGGLGK